MRCGGQNFAEGVVQNLAAEQTLCLTITANGLMTYCIFLCSLRGPQILPGEPSGKPCGKMGFCLGTAEDSLAPEITKENVFR